MSNCAFEWIGPIQWWCHMGASGQAAWVQAIGTILAISVAIFVPYWQKRQEKREKRENERKVVMSAAANLDVALGDEGVLLAFAPAGDGIIGHEFNLDQAAHFMKLKPESRNALERAIEMSHYFDRHLCEKIVLLGIEGSAYEQAIEETLRVSPSMSADTFFETMKPRKERLLARLIEVRELLKAYLPKLPTK